MRPDSPLSEARSLLVLGVPLIGSHLAQVAMHVTDTVMLGWYAVDALAAAVLGATVFFTLFVVGAGFAKAVMPMVAAAAIRGDDTEVRRVTRMGLWLSTGFAIATLPLFHFSDRLLPLLGQDPGVSALTAQYLRIAGWGMIPALLVMVLKSYLAALERTQVALWVTVAAAILNGFINWALIFGNWGAPELGVRGAAVATVATQVFSLAALAAYAVWLPALRRYALLVRLWRSDPSALRAVFRLGWPMGLTSLAESGLFSATAIMVGWIGTHELAAHGIAMELASLTFMIHLGLSNAATVRAGRAFGQGDAAGLRRVGRVAIALSGAFALATVATFLAAGESLVRLFLDPADPAAEAIVPIGVTLLAVAALFQVADAGQVMALGLLAGVQDTRVPMVLASVSYWLVGIPAGWLIGFGLGLGAAGIWLGLVVGLVCAGVLLMARFWGGAARRIAPPARAAGTGAATATHP